MISFLRRATEDDVGAGGIAPSEEMVEAKVARNASRLREQQRRQKN